MRRWGFVVAGMLVLVSAAPATLLLTTHLRPLRTAR